jgi:hypothetical protein
MTLFELLQAGDSSFAIAGGLLAIGFFVARWRKAAIQGHYKDLAFIWTNEGAIDGDEPIFIHLALQLSHGELYGTLTSPQFDESYEVHVNPGWFYSTANISLLRGKGLIPITEVKLTLRGNRNRLAWKLSAPTKAAFLPRDTELWPISEPQNGAA